MICTFSQISDSIAPCRFFGFGGNQPSGAVILTSLLVLLAACGTAPTPSSTTPVEPVIETSPAEPVAETVLDIQVNLEAVNNARFDYAKNFDVLAQMADKQKKPKSAEEFRMYAAMLRNEFVAVELTAPKQDGDMDLVPVDSNGKARFTLYDGNYFAAMDAYGKYFPDFDSGPPLLMLDEYVG